MEKFRVVDAHHHLWDLEHLYYPWLSDRIRSVAYGDYSTIRKNYLLADFRADFGVLNVVKSVHVQAEQDPQNPVAETEWLQSVADDPSSQGFPHAIVAFVDLSSSEAEAILDSHRRHKNLRGVRQMLHFGESATYLTNSNWLDNLTLLSERNLSFDLQIRPSQIRDAVTAIESHPKLPFILNHAALPPLNQEESKAKRWKESITELAELNNVAIKLSGFGTISPNWTAETIKPFVEHLISSFGVDRCMFGSNFPVDSLMKDYPSVWSAYFEVCSGYSGRDKEKLFATNAERLYRI